MKEEIDELKITISEKNDQLQEYRIKVVLFFTKSCDFTIETVLMNLYLA